MRLGLCGVVAVQQLRSKLVKKVLIVCGLLVIIAGCSGGDDGNGGPGKVGDVKPTNGDKPEAVAEEDEPKGEGKAWDPALGTATVSGVAKFSGKPPRRRPIDMSGKQECAKIHSEPVLDESIILGEEGALANVFVWVKKGLKGWDFPTPSEPVVLNQQGCMFHPHVQGVQTGQDILIRNSDPVTHNIHAFPNRNNPFNFSQAKQGAEETQQFRRRDVMVKIKCDVHTWMNGYLGVVDHPFFVTTGEDGKFELPKLPPGEYTIEAWHEEFGAQTEKVTLGDGESKELEFTFKDK